MSIVKKISEEGIKLVRNQCFKSMSDIYVYNLCLKSMSEIYF